MDKYDVLKEKFGYESFRGTQEEIIDSILKRNNTIAIMPTGGGKSICFQIPALILDGLTIVVSPLISLMYDQVRELKEKNIPAAYINSYIDANLVYNSLDKIKILYVSPERLANPLFLNNIKNIKISNIIVDEAHTIMWHMDFRESFLNIRDFINYFDYKIPITLFTATANKYTIEEIKVVTGIYNYLIIRQSFDRPELYYKIVKNVDKLAYIKKYLIAHDTSGIIYAQTRKDVMFLFDSLKEFSTTYYHGALDNEIKEKNQDDFISGKKKVIISTVAFGMGINKPNIRFIINYNIPDSIESLAQMTGRCSRDKEYGECIVLYNNYDVKVLNYFIKNIDLTYKNKKESLKIKQYKYYQLNSILYLCNKNICIHRYMAFYFGDKIKNCIKMCSRCKKD